jgi:3-hydroxybutyryl-CoA dehydratase
MYFEDFTPGLTVLTASRTITVQDIVTFTALSGDNSPIHVDEDFAASTSYGHRIAHGLLCASIASGLAIGTGMTRNLVVSREIHWRFLKPVFIGDSLSVEIMVKKTRSIKQQQFGYVVFEMRVLKKPHILTSLGTWESLFKTRN